MSSPLQPRAHGFGRGQHNCTICHGIGYVKRNVPLDHADFGVMFPCKCVAADIERERREKLLEIAGARWNIDRTINDLIILPNRPGTEAMISATKDMIAGPYGMLTIWGTWGNGKTLALEAIAAHALRNGKTAIYGRFQSLYEWCNQGYKTGAKVDFDGRYRMLRDADYLCIDEFEPAFNLTDGIRKVKMTDAAQKFLAELIDDRYLAAKNLERHTAFAMNIHPDQLDPYVYERLTYGTLREDGGGFRIIENKDASLRGAGI